MISIKYKELCKWAEVVQEIGTDGTQRQQLEVKTELSPINLPM
jgi:hypothetical protein